MRSSWTLRVAAVVLLVGVYVLLWRPARVALASHVVHPLVTSVSTPRSQQFVVEQVPRAVKVYRTASPEMMETSYTVPAGAFFLVPAVLLLLLNPRKPYWLYVFAAHLGLGVVSLLGLLTGLGWTQAGLELLHMTRFYLLPAATLAILVLALVREGVLPGLETDHRGPRTE